MTVKTEINVLDSRVVAELCCRGLDAPGGADGERGSGRGPDGGGRGRRPPAAGKEAGQGAAHGARHVHALRGVDIVDGVMVDFAQQSCS